VTGGARLAHDWLDSPLPSNVRIGEGSWLHSAFAFLHCRSRRPTAVAIGDHSGVYIGSMFELGPEGEVHIGDYVTVVGAIIATNGLVAIGDRSFIAHEVVIADHGFARPHDEIVSEGVPLDGLQGHTRGPTLGADVWVGMRATIVGPVTIGDGAVIGAGTTIRQDVEPLTVVAGDPPRLVRRLAPAAHQEGA
jgi:acetyltransferase-like isoleucine patch superfamily enzyme